MKKQRLSICDILFFCALVPLLFFFLWKCRYGYGGCDEPFYLTLAQRLSFGDALLSDEWNLSQLCGVLLLPFYRLHALIAGGTEGIVLHFRYLYTAMQLLTAAFLYLTLRRYRYGALCAVLLFALYTPYDIMALSYNTFALMAMALCLCLLSCCRPSGRIGFLLAGFCYAVAVIANPYLILLYLTAAVLFLLALLVRAAPKLSRHPSEFMHPEAFRTCGRGLLLFTLGAAIPAVCLLLFVFSRAGIKTIMENLSAILHDPEHASRSVKEILYSAVYAMRSVFGSFLALWLLLTVLALIDRKKTHAWMYFCMTALVTATAVMIHIPSIQTDYNYIMFPVTLCGLSAYLLTRQKNHRVFLFLWCLGMFYAFCLGAASNQGENAICMGMPAALIGSVLLIQDFVKEQLAAASPSSAKSGRFTAPLVLCSAALLFLSQFGAECYAKSVHAFWEPSVSVLDTKITEGPLAGVCTTKEHADAYDTLLSEIRGYQDGSSDPVLFVTSSPWCYLYAERPYGVYSSWISTFSASDKSAGVALLLDRLGVYYRLHPDRIPSDIYLLKNDIWSNRLSGWENGYPLAAWLLTTTNIDPSPLYPYDCAEWDILYDVTETAHGFHLRRISAP
ncbi:MAG: hypothetical protein NC254_03830 [bacterium]|nr:hypothetical protein [bacterium]